MGTAVEPGRFTVIDFETTAVEPGLHGRALEVGIVSLEATPTLVDGQRGLVFNVVDTWDTLINPGPGVGVGASQIHRITEDMVADAPTFEEVAGDILRRLSDTTVVAHNARFDLGFLDYDCNQGGIVLPELAVVCTLELARYVSQRSGENNRRHTLAACCERAGIAFGEMEQHSALGDAAVTAQLFDYLVARLHGFGEELTMTVRPATLDVPESTGRRLPRHAALTSQAVDDHQPRLFDDPRTL